MIPSILINNIEAQYHLLNIIDPEHEILDDLWWKERITWTKNDWERALNVCKKEKREAILNFVIKKNVELVESNETRLKSDDDQTDCYRWFVDHFKNGNTYQRKWYFKK